EEIHAAVVGALGDRHDRADRRAAHRQADRAEGARAGAVTASALAHVHDRSVARELLRPLAARARRADRRASRLAREVRFDAGARRRSALGPGPARDDPRIGALGAEALRVGWPGRWEERGIAVRALGVGDGLTTLQV